MYRMWTRVRAEEKVIRHVKAVERRGWDFRVTQGALGGWDAKRLQQMEGKVSGQHQ